VPGRQSLFSFWKPTVAAGIGRTSAASFSLLLGDSLRQVVERVCPGQVALVTLVRVIEVRHRALEQARRDQRYAARHDSFAGLPEAGFEEHPQLPDHPLDRLHVFFFLRADPCRGSSHHRGASLDPDLVAPPRDLLRGRRTHVSCGFGGTSAGLKWHKHRLRLSRTRR
jgi:hypothetical protein